MEEEKIIKEQIDNAAPAVKELLKSGSWTSVSGEIVKKYNLLPNQTDAFENEVLFVLLGLELIKDFTANIRINVGLTEGRAAEISGEVYVKIFKDIETFLPVGVENDSTKETKKEIIDRLSQRVENARQGGNPNFPAQTHPSLPMVEPGESAHSVAPMTEKEKVEIKEKEEKTAPPTPIPIKIVPGVPEIRPVKIMPEKEPASQPPVSQAEPAPTQTNPSPKTPIADEPAAKADNPRYPGGVDPYREPV